MDSHLDLKILFKAINDGALTPQVLPQIGGAWLASGHLSLVKFLVEKGYLSEEQVKKLETAINIDNHPSPELDQTLVAPGVTPQPDTGKGKKPESGTHPQNHTPSTFSGGKITGLTNPVMAGGERYSQFRSFRKGGPGQIWLVWDNALGRDVIVKSLRPDLARKPAMLTRFIREARLTGQLEHPNIIPLYDLMGDDQDSGNWAYSMRFVSGPTLAEAIEKYHIRLAKREATHLDLVYLLDAFVLLCRAVAFAHSRNVIHRDLKGQNVVLGDFGEVILLDWGLGKRIGETDPEETVDVASLKAFDRENLTIPGTINGTPAYMGPEVARGEAATKASDIYSLGAILYAILTGRPPYKGANALETLDLVKNDPPPPPCDLNPAVHPALEAITLKAMERTPAQRYQSPDTLANDVRRWLVDEPVSVYPDPATVRMMRFARKYRTIVVAAAALLITAVMTLSWSSVRIWNEQQKTLQQMDEAQKNYQLARDLSQSSINLMEKSEAYYSTNEDLSTARKKILDSTAKAYESFLDQDPLNLELQKGTAMVLRYAANVHRLDDEFDQAGRMLEESLRIQENLANELPGDELVQGTMVQTKRDRSTYWAMKGDLVKAKKDIDQVIDAYKLIKSKAANPYFIPRGLLIANFELTELLLKMEMFGDALKSAKTALDGFRLLIEQTGEEQKKPYDKVLQIKCLNLLAITQRKMGNYEESMKTHDLALAKFADYFGKKENWTGLVYRDVSRTDLINTLLVCRRERVETLIAKKSKDTESVERGLEALVKEWSDQVSVYPNRFAYAATLAGTHTVLGNYYLTQGKTNLAQSQLNTALAILEPLVGKKPARISYFREAGLACLELARLEKKLGNDKNANALLEKAIGYFSEARTLFPDNVEIQRAMENLRIEP